jgi:hypothetical protein
MCGTWQPARSNDPDIFVFPFLEKVLRRRGSLELPGGDEVGLASVHSQHVCHHFAGASQRGPIGVSALSFSLVHRCELFAEAGRQPAGLDQHPLDMLVALLGKRRAHAGQSSTVLEVALAKLNPLLRPESLHQID